MSYTVGQVLFICVKNKPTIAPVRVVEELTKKTLEGEQTTYIVEMCDGTRSELAIVADNVFATAKHAEKFLIERATASIKALIEIAIEMRDKHFGKKSESEDMKLAKETARTSLPDLGATLETSRGRQLQSVEGHVLPQEASVVMPDGTTVKVVM